MDPFNIVWGILPLNNSQTTNENDQPQDHHDDDIPGLEPINIPNTQVFTTQHDSPASQLLATPSEDDDIRMGSGGDMMPSLQSISGSPEPESNHGSDSDRDAIEVEMQTVENASPGITSPNQPRSQYPSLSQRASTNGASDSRPTGQRTSSRRVRMEEDDDDDRDRRHPSHRIVEPDPAPMRADNPPLVSAQGEIQPTSAPPATENPNPNPPNPAPPAENSNPTRIFGGFAITLDLSSGQPVAIDLSTGQPINGLGPGLHPPPSNAHAAPSGNPLFSGNIIPPGANQSHAPNPTTGVNQNTPQPQLDEIPLPPPPSLPALLARLGALGAVFGSLNEPETDDPERADRMVRALEVVPEGLVERLERVGEGEQGGCAVCWEGLGSSLGWSENDEARMPSPDELGPLGAPSPPDSPSTTPPPTETEPQPKPKLAPLPKIVALPCAHVFHSSCLIPWFSRPRQTTCPTCRFDIDPEGATYGGGRRARPMGMNFNAMNFGPGPTLNHPEGVAGFTPISRPPRPGETIPPIPQRPQAPTAPRSQVDADAIAALDGEMRLGMGMDIDRDNGTINNDSHNAAPPAPSAPAPRPRSLLTIGFDIIFTGSPFPPPNVIPPHPPTPTARAPNPSGFNFGGIFAPGGPAATHGTADDGQQPNVEASGRPAPEDHQRVSDEEIREWHQVTTDEELRRLLEHDPSSDTEDDGDIVLEQMIFTDGDPNDDDAAGHEHEDREPENPPRDGPLPNGLPFGFAGFPPPGAPFGGTRFASGTGRTVGEAMQQLLGGLNAGGNPNPNPNVPTNPQGAQVNGGEAQNNEPGAMGAAFLTQLLGGIAQFPPARAAPTTQNPDGPPAEGQGQMGPQPPPPPAAQPGPGPQAPTPADFLAHLFGGGVPVAMGAAPMPPHLGGGPTAQAQAGAYPGARRPREKAPWTLPLAPGLTLRERVEKKERERGWRCWDACCGFGPSDEEPVPDSNDSGYPAESTEGVETNVTSKKMNAPNQLIIRNEVSLRAVCSHRFHAACLVTSERIARNGQEPDVTRNEIEVQCKVCREPGCVLREEWEEGARALAAMA